MSLLAKCILSIFIQPKEKQENDYQFKAGVGIFLGKKWAKIAY